MELAEAREAARKLIDRADRGVPVETPAPHPRSSTALTLGGLLDRYEALRTREGKRIKTLAEAMRLLRRNLKPYLSLPADQFSQGRPARRPRRHGRGRHRDRGQPHARLSRPGDALGGTGRSDPDQLRAGHPPGARAEAQPQADRGGDHGDLERLRRSRQPRGGEELRPHGALPAGDGAAPRRGGLASPRSYPRRHVAADRRTRSDRPHSLTLPPLALDTGRAGRARRTTCSPAASARSPASRN